MELYTIKETSLVEELLINFDYDKVKDLSLEDKMFFFKYVNLAYWGISHKWNQFDKDLFYSINIKVNHDWCNKINYLCIYDNNKSIYDERKKNLFMSMPDDIFLNNVFNFYSPIWGNVDIDIQQRLLSLMSCKDIYRKFIPYYCLKLKATDAKFKSHISIYNNIEGIINVCRFCNWNVPFDELNKVLYVHFTLCNHTNENTIKITKEEKEMISKCFEAKTLIRNPYSIAYILKWLDEYITVEEEKEMIRKTTLTSALKEINYSSTFFDELTVSDVNKKYVKMARFELKL